jgi:Tfp pilus assembly protein PilF
MSEAMIVRLEDMLARGQDNALLRFGLGTNYFKLKDFDKAATHLAISLEQDPQQSAAWKTLGRCYQKLDQKEKALEAFQAGLKASKANGDKQVEREIDVFINKLSR